MANNPFGKTFEEAGKRYGLAPGTLSTFARIESGYNPNVTTGSYKGLFQLSDTQFKKYGGQGNIYDPYQNTSAGAAKIADLKSQFKRKFGRDPSLTELYMTHQQGFGGATAHLSNPSAPAWQNMYSTAEGRRKGPEWAKRAIWGNVPRDVRAKYGNRVENMTSADFLNMWDEKVRRFSGQGGTKSLAQPTGDVTTATGPEPPPGVIPPMTSDIATGSTGMAIKYQNAPGDPNALMQGAELDVGARRSQMLAEMLQKQSQQGKDVKHWLHGLSLPISAGVASYMMGQEDQNTLGQRELLADSLASGDYSPMQRSLAMQGNKAALQTIAQQDSADRTFNRDRYYKGIDEEREHRRALELQREKAISAAKAREQARRESMEDKKTYHLWKEGLEGASKVANKHPDYQNNAGVKITATAVKDFNKEQDEAVSAMQSIAGFDKAFGGLGKGWEVMGKYALQFADKDWMQLSQIASQKGGSEELKKAALWWRNFRKYNELPERHELFGATLTQGEAEAWKSATISPEMDPEQIQAALDRRKEVLARAQARGINMRMSTYAGGREWVNGAYRLGLSPEQIATMSNDDIVKVFWEKNNKRHGLNLPFELYLQGDAYGAAPAAPAAPAEAAPATPAAPTEAATPAVADQNAAFANRQLERARAYIKENPGARQRVIDRLKAAGINPEGL